MARTYIIAADGTRYEEMNSAAATRRNSRAKIARRIISAAALIITALFLSAAIIGMSNAARAGATPSIAPTAQQGISIKAAKVGCRKAPRGAMQDCLNLFMRHAWSSGGSFTAEGAILVRDCISQYRGAELADCFTQEIR